MTVEEARVLAEQVHEGKFRQSGEPFFSHFVAVADIIVREWGITDKDYSIAALLHDVIEDSQITLQEISSRFGSSVATLVDGVTKFRSEGGRDHDQETLKKVLGRSYLNPGVAIIKLADRLHNMRTLQFMPPEEQIAKAQETLQVYTGLAESLGMWVVKKELEDLAFSFLDPYGYQAIRKEIEADPRLDPLFTTFVKTDLERLLLESGLSGKVEVVVEGRWALREKRKKMALSGRCTPDRLREINDVVSFRVILDRIEDCYLFLHKVHETFGQKVDYERFDEFVGANRRDNGYSALQTTLNLNQGAVEIAMVTQEMEEFNNWGVASLIKKGEKDPRDYVLKLVFTPSGEVKFLPKEATAIDFAYAINPRLGAEAESVLIDGQESPLTVVIPNSSTVEIKVGKPRRAPDPKLIEYCLPSARRLIEEQLRQAERDKLVEKGRAMIKEILTSRGLLDLADLGEIINPLFYKFGCQGINDLYFKIGGGYLSLKTIAQELDREGVGKESLGGYFSGSGRLDK